MYAADWIVDVGSGRGHPRRQHRRAGHAWRRSSAIRTVDHRAVPVGQEAHRGARRCAVSRTGFLTVRGAKEHNLKNIDVNVPARAALLRHRRVGFGQVAAWSTRSSTSTLAKVLNRAKTRPGAFDSMEGVEQLDKIICIDQSPIGRTPRSNPATYTGLFDQIRKIFAAVPGSEGARLQGRTASPSTSRAGAARTAAATAMLKIEMHFLPDIFVPCDVCKGKRYNRETLEVTYKGKNISDVLDMNIEEAITFFENHESIRRKLETLYDVGLGVHEAGAGIDDPFRRRSAAREAGDGTQPPRDGQDALCLGRADDRAAHGRRGQAHRRLAAPDRQRATACW